MQEMTEIIDSKKYSIAHYYNGNECYDLVKESSINYWANVKKINSIENYRFDDEAKPWSLGPMLKNNEFELGYTVLSIDDKPWAFAGIRKYTDDIAVVLARLFCFFTVKPICYGFLLPFHLQIAKENGYTKAWTSLNEYNIHIYKTWTVKEYNKHPIRKRDSVLYQNNDRMISTSTFLGERVLFNTNQNVIEWNL